MKKTIRRNENTFIVTMNEDGKMEISHNGGLPYETFATKSTKGEWFFDGNRIKELKAKLPTNANILISSPAAEEWYHTSRRIKEERRISRYDDLKATLPKLELPKSTPNVEKKNEIMSKTNTKYFDNKEFKNINLSILSNNEKLARQASQYCEHNINVEYNYTYTQDARHKIIRTATCGNCGLKIVDVVEEDVKYNWR